MEQDTVLDMNLPIAVAERACATATGEMAAHIITRDIPPDVEEYSSSVSGVEIEAVRIGPEVARSHVLAVTGGRFVFTASKVGFPMFSHTTVPDDTVIVATITSAPPGSRWCEIPLEPGQVIVYSPRAEHVARNMPGLEFMFACFDVESLQAHAAQLGASIEVPSLGEVHLLADTSSTTDIAPTFTNFADVAETARAVRTQHEDDVLRAAVHALSDPQPARSVGADTRIDSRRVVITCIEFAESIGRIPSVSELCAIAHVSERRLRFAFTNEFDMPPTRFFRAWALSEAHRRLAHRDAADRSVARVAADLGFDHLGRFSGYYRDIFDECPSETLRHVN